jgi:GT2 family glycosyltransferase
MNKSILVICVNYNTYSETLKFVNDVFSQNLNNINLTLIIVDNSDIYNYNQYDEIRELLNDNKVLIYKPERNLGYFGGASFGLKKYVENHQIPDWIIVSNTDIELIQQDFFIKLIDLYKDNCTPAVIAPKILSSISGKNQNPFMKKRPGVLRMKMYELIFRYYFLFQLYQNISDIKNLLIRYKRSIKKNKKYINDLSPYDIYAPHGSFIIFHKSYFDHGGNLDFGAFLFQEEIFIAEKARNLKLCIRYDPRLIVLHNEHSTTKNLKNILKYKYESAKYIVDEFFSRKK